VIRGIPENPFDGEARKLSVLCKNHLNGKIRDKDRSTDVIYAFKNENEVKKLMIIPRVHVVFYKLIIQGKITLPLSNALTTYRNFLVV
jgi:hypothetical protein